MTGKNLSGSGLDYNVVGMWRRIGGERVPNFERIAVLDLTDESDGNGLGVGIADFTTRRLYDKLDLDKMYLNGITSGALEAIKIPIVLDSDRQALGVALHSTGRGADARAAIVRSTLDLENLWVSEALVDDVATNSRLEVLGPPTELAFSGRRTGRGACCAKCRSAPRSVNWLVDGGGHGRSRVVVVVALRDVVERVDRHGEIPRPV